MESITYLKNIKIPPKKMRFLLSAIKKMSPSHAVEYLLYSPEKTGKIYYKAINSAIANAKLALKVPDNVLEFKVLTVEEGQKLKRYKAGARGTARPFVRRYSHIKIVLSAKDEQTVVKAEPKEKVAPTKEKSVKEAKPKVVTAKSAVKKEGKSKVTNKKA